MSKAVYRFSSIARPLEPDYPTNRWVLILLPIVALGLAGLAWGVHGEDWRGVVEAGLDGLFTAFLVWALGREIDPDRNVTAFLAMAFAVASLAAGVDPAIWTLVFTLMATRIVNRSVGLAARPLDMVLVAVLALLAVWRDGQVLAGAIGALAITLDVAFDRARRVYLLLALAALGATVWALAGGNGSLATALGTLDGLELACWVLLVAGGLILVLTCPAPRSTGDATGEVLEARRVRSCVLIAWLVAVASIAGGSATLQAALPVWMAIVAAMTTRLVPGRGTAGSD